jgi:hypothetical protein
MKKPQNLIDTTYDVEKINMDLIKNIKTARVSRALPLKNYEHYIENSRE